MINKKIMNSIKKELKKNGMIIIMHLPTEEEKEYLKKFNIMTEIVPMKCQGIVSDYYYDTEMCMYYLDK